MLLISHRGNISGPDPKNENRQEYIEDAINKGYDVEIDVWKTRNGLFLGHDNAEYPVTLNWLKIMSSKLWMHTKNFEAMDFLIDKGFMLFYHKLEKHTVIANTTVFWSHDLSEASPRSIVPMLSLEDMEKWQNSETEFYGICSDYIERFKNEKT